MFKVNHKDTRTISLKFSLCFYVEFKQISLYLVNLEFEENAEPGGC